MAKQKLIPTPDQLYEQALLMEFTQKYQLMEMLKADIVTEGQKLKSEGEKAANVLKSIQSE